ncbi:MAG TPA: thiamine pyrophosphate-dependent enzyme, partial [Gemmatimonadales bacterium]|nr:thiamine pyrophosphate-dependent enzyme [Gemmatimonadales bacterium]
DGDALSIGGNHTLHLLRRNVNVQIILFNNEIYGLTKGQYSPTSRQGTRTPSTPQGSIENPLGVCGFALGAGGRFVARAIDTDQAHLVEVLKRAHAHRGASFVDVFQNCVVYNDAVFESFTAKDVAKDMQVHLKHGEPMLFGKNRDRGLRLKPGKLELEIVTLGQNGITLDDVLVHDETDRMLAWVLASIGPPAFPVPIGVLFCNPASIYEDAVMAQVDEAHAKAPSPDLRDLLTAGGTWTVDGS